MFLCEVLGETGLESDMWVDTFKKIRREVLGCQYYNGSKSQDFDVKEQ